MFADGGKKWGYVIAWEFRPKAGDERRFEEANGSSGIWARLFRTADGFVGTELIRDCKDMTRYVTLDFWVSKTAYEKFRAERASDYAAIDAQCESLTDFERELGQFEKVDR
jgi:heme-degrading monooxygenase HmoA